MPRIQIPITKVSETPVDVPAVTVADLVNDHYLDFNDGNIWLEVQNTDAAVARAYNFITPAVVGVLGAKDTQISVPANTTIVQGPLMPRVYNQKSGVDAGKVYIDPGHAALRFRAFHLNPVATGRIGGQESTTSRVRIPITEIFTEEHLPAQVQPAYIASDPTDDHELAFNDGRVILEINNLAAAAHDVVMNVNALAYGPRSTVGGPVEIADNIITVPANGHVIAGGFTPRVYNELGSLQPIPGGGGTMENLSRLHLNVTTDQLQLRAFHLPRVGDRF